MTRRLSPRIRRAIIGAGVAALAAVVWLRFGPLPADLLDPGEHQSTTVLDRNGEVLYESRSEDGTRGVWLDGRALPPNLVSATIAAEDRRFYRHLGLDPLAILRAAWRNLREGAIVEGGSTISQQVAKLLVARASAPVARAAGLPRFARPSSRFASSIASPNRRSSRSISISRHTAIRSRAQNARATPTSERPRAC